MARAETVTYDGQTWYRRASGYWSNPRSGLLHRYVYTQEVGPIPDGWHVHHRDYDRGNNAAGNLLALDPVAHRAVHGPQDRDWHVAGGRASALTRTPKAAVCVVCGAEWTALRATHAPRFCSPRCRDAGAPSRARVDRVCSVCGGGFTTSRRSSARTCSPTCRSVAAYAAR